MDKPKKYEDRLMQVIRFDEIDLEANQAGVISAGQRKTMLRRTAGYSVTVSVLLLLLWSAWQSFEVLWIMVCGFLFVGFCLRLGQQILDFISQRAVCVEGYIQQDIPPYKAATHLLIVEDRRFNVNKQVFLAFKNGDPYRIYYAPYSKRILSVEWLRDDNLL